MENLICPLIVNFPGQYPANYNITGLFEYCPMTLQGCTGYCSTMPHTVGVAWLFKLVWYH